MSITTGHLLRRGAVAVPDHRCAWGFGCWISADVACPAGCPALDAAAAADADFDRGRIIGPLQGVPVAVKDLLHTAGFATAAGSRALSGFLPARDAVAVRRLRDAGAVLIGKTVTYEFGYGLDVPATRNAWATDSYPGGSSAGSAVALASGTVYAALGTDTAGSIRVPASVNGVVGLKPTFGRVSTRGVFPMSTTMDTVGPMARTVSDVATVLSAIVGADPEDSNGFRDTSASSEPRGDYSGWSGQDLTGVRIGVEHEYFLDHAAVTDEVRAATITAIEALANRGATVIEITIADIDFAVAAGMTVMLAEASEWHQPLLRGRGSSYDPDVRTMVELGELILAAGYLKAQRARSVVRRSYRAAFEQHQLTALIAPTVPATAMPISELTAHTTSRTRSHTTSQTPHASTAANAMAGIVHHNILANVIGVPALTLPVGFDATGRPIGAQLYGRPFAEGDLLRIGTAYRAVTTWHNEHPELDRPSGSGGCPPGDATRTTTVRPSTG